MTPATIRLHQQLLRLAKGMLSAWEEWLTAQAESRGK
jgi:hypothetical protein